MQSANPYSATEQLSSRYESQPTSRSLRINRIDAMAVGKLLGVLYGILGLVAGLFLAVMGGIGAVAGGNAAGAPAAVGGVVFAILMLVLMPLIYGAIGFVAGALGALIYNVCAGFIGGIVIEVDG